MTRSAWAVLLVLVSCSGNKPTTGPVTCAEGLKACGEACADVRLDSQHCGECGQACPEGQACAGGQCYAKACGNVTCAASHVCLDGACLERVCFGVQCPGGEACANGACLKKDCAGVQCRPDEVCADSRCQEAGCVGVICPAGAVCANGTCQRDSCNNGTKDGTETDTDCGGICAPCATSSRCMTGEDCRTLNCNNQVCADATCFDHIRNQDEGDTDCGGVCPKCADGRRCTGPLHCQSNVCAAGACATPSCTDGIKNGNESDRDCGGSCAACPPGYQCGSAADCNSGICQNSSCISAQCQNAVKDGNESDIDCGGTCSPCLTGKTCNVGADCLSAICDGNMRCAQPTCTDAKKNGTETDLDCGGGCPACAVGKLCSMGSDCLTKSCRNGMCAVATCTDAVQNGSESDIDCGGTLCTGCTAGRRCVMTSDCITQSCDGGICEPQGIFNPPVQFPIGAGARDLAVGDLDGDNLADLVASSETAYELSVLYGSTDGGLDRGQVLVVGNATGGQGPAGVAIGDVNGDGRQDLVTTRTVAGPNGGIYNGGHACMVSLFAGATARGYLSGVDTRSASYCSGVGCQSTCNVFSGCGYRAATGRIDADARYDVLVGDELRTFGDGCADSLGGLVFRSDPMTGFVLPPPFLTQGGPFVVTADVNLDGFTDVITRSNRYSRVRVFLGSGSASLAAPLDATVLPGTGELAVARVDTDNFPDLVVASRSSNRIGIGLGVGNGTFLAPQSYPVTNPDGVAVADFDMDGKFDVVVGGMGLAFLKGRGDGTFDPPVVFFANLGDTGVVHAGDFNGDSKPDVALLTDRVWLLINGR